MDTNERNKNQYIEYLESLLIISNSLLEKRDYPSLIEEILTDLVLFTKCKRCLFGYFRLDQTKEPFDLRITAFRELSKEYVEAYDKHRHINPYSKSVWENKTVNIDDLSENSFWELTRTHLPEVHSVIFVPVPNLPKLKSFFMVFSEEKQYFDKILEKCLTIFATQCASALKNVVLD